MQRQDRRGYLFEKEHLKLENLIARAGEIHHVYLNNDNIPAYPRPEFHVSHLKHDTNKDAVRDIWRTRGFRDPHQEDTGLLWWSLTVTPDEISSAARRLLEETFPDLTKEQMKQQESFLEKFLTSPAFDGTSRLGSFRFTFTVEELLKAYSEQFCSCDEPIMRIYKTELFTEQEVMYVVLVHSPEDQELFSDYPLLTDHPDAVCSYRDGHFIWRAQAMSETHRYRLIQRDDDQQMEAVDADCPHQLYVWDHVAIALHVDKKMESLGLRFHVDQLRENLMFCEEGNNPMIPHEEFQDYPDADEFVRTLWPDCTSPLKRLKA